MAHVDSEFEHQEKVSRRLSHVVGGFSILALASIWIYVGSLDSSCTQEQTVVEIIKKTSNADSISNITVMRMSSGEVSVKNGTDFSVGQVVCTKQKTTSRLF